MSKAYRRSECEPSLLTDILLIFKSSVIFGLSVTPGGSEVKFWGCNQCLSKAGQNCTEVMSRHCRGRKKAPTYIGVCVIYAPIHMTGKKSSQEQDVSPVLHQTFATLSRKMVNRYQLSICKKIVYVCISVYLLIHYEFSTQENKKRTI